MKKVIASPISDNVMSPKSANTAVVNTDANIKGYPAFATGKAEWLGMSGQINLLIKYALVDFIQYKKA
jgi:hypothetical protein